ncbi:MULTISPECIES: cardiolipin synthase ClsB [Achromobacter]|jgi:cardiolipin synthase|uniref:cardiolipin synthase ClsB n=1 Tax=Achromobacter TaxID=222 RepID=UPI000D4E3D98|nr:MULTISPECIES: cardiolipin synthase ClsB [Achromobacter]PTN52184.1 cardiolipin synthase ClsB [Achromobacter xylosoxidans]MBD9380259.1 cardiolipin synthase ClsB [Achromobacter sp. ACM02]MBD9429019.1 cardiolipin synthase ClsB [Achromobacter sp. ACM03]MDQ1760357.1 cardiolipin synthase ClsB [Achromobacter aegrifaciens]RIJ05957.1 cardiolipin synthase ClsB [Achromobacter sp. K91]
MNLRWRENNRYTLLENGTGYFPAVLDAIAAARGEVLVETFILFDDAVGQEFQRALIAAARRGVSVDLTVDGYGSDELDGAFVGAMTESGIRVHVFDPRPRFLGVRTNVFRRMHRKIVAVDRQMAFVGGINFSADHLPDYGPQAKQDYAVLVEGPLAADIADYAREALAVDAWTRKRRRPARLDPMPEGDGGGRLVVRDNIEHQTDIERYYRAGVRAAREDVLIANAYFFPGYQLLHDLANAARRGVRVRLLLQGEPDVLVARLAASMLYDYLIDAGVEIYEYCKRPLHGKVACVDRDWSTIGSSNLDPLSLALNLEANVVARDAGLNAALRRSLDRLIEQDCRRIELPEGSRRRLRRLWIGVVVFHFLRRFPAWAGSLPAHKPRLKSLPIAAQEESA